MNPAQSTPEDIPVEFAVRQVAERYFAACNAHDADAMVAMWEAGGVEHYPALEEGYRAPNELRAHLRTWFSAAPDVRWDVASITADGERAIVYSTMTGAWTGRFQGLQPRQRFAIEGVDIIEIRDGKITHNTCLVDQGSMMRELGLLPPRHSLAERALQRVLNAIWRLRGAEQP
jgi:steroid delta-isomerase-like uncharacterized protein